MRVCRITYIRIDWCNVGRHHYVEVEAFVWVLMPAPTFEAATISSRAAPETLHIGSSCCWWIFRNEVVVLLSHLVEQFSMSGTPTQLTHLIGIYFAIHVSIQFVVSELILLRISWLLLVLHMIVAWRVVAVRRCIHIWNLALNRVVIIRVHPHCRSNALLVIVVSVWGHEKLPLMVRVGQLADPLWIEIIGQLMTSLEV